jgi:hypothetical protein
LTLTLLPACDGTDPNGSASSPSPSPDEAPAGATLEEAESLFCAELPRIQDALEAGTRIQSNPTEQSVTDAVTLMTSEADRVEVAASTYEEAGDSLKAADIQALADGFRQSAEDLSSILQGQRPGAGPNMAILTEQALEGVTC